MEALTAIGLIANIVQFVDLGAKLIGSAKEMRDSASGMTVENKSLEEVTVEMRDLTSRLDPPTTKAKSDDEKALRRLAQECRELSDQILHLLKKIAPSKPNSTLSSIRSAIRTIKYKDEMRELEEKLAKCRGQLHLHFSKLTSSKIQAQLQDLQGRAQSTQAILQMLPQQIDRIRRDTCVGTLGAEALHQIKELLGLTQVAQETVVGRFFLKYLAYEGMQARVDVIAKEHSETFRWIVEQNADVDDVTLKTNARELYLSWLHHGIGIFQVAGKLGSGKSTLMKFLFRHPETRSQLLAWAGQTKLVVASHFFWKPAKLSLQKSLNGLERSLLYQLLESHQELARTAFPELWELLLKSEFGQFRARSAISSDEIHDGFMALLKDETIQRSYRFCFFIDALDEHEESPQYDHRYLVDALREWTQISPNSIKLCVSSREDNVFENAFASDPRIRLQDLTRHDMERFARSRLVSIPDVDTRERLTRDIVKRSDGIFLWVVLVIKQLRQALEDGRDTSSFEEELATLPTELEDLFKHLLGSIPRSQRKKAYQIFAMVQKHETLPIKLSLLSCLYLEKYQGDGQFATRKPSAVPNLETQDNYEPHTWYETQVKKARRRLQGLCKGLVEDRASPKAYKVDVFLRDKPHSNQPEHQDTHPDPSKPAGSRCILFVHRTIVEFLFRSTSFETLERSSDKFDAVESISWLHLAEFQSIPSPLVDQMYWCFLYKYLIRLRFRVGKDRSHFDFLVELEHTISKKFPGWLENELNPSKERYWDVGVEDCVLVASGTGDHFATARDYTQIPKRNYVQIHLKSPVYISACLGNASYILWRTMRPDGLLLSDQPAGVALHCLHCSLPTIERSEDFEKTVTCFEQLLNNSASPAIHYLWPAFITKSLRSLGKNEPMWSRIIGQLIAVFLNRHEMRGLHTTEILIDKTRLRAYVTIELNGSMIMMQNLELPPTGTTLDKFGMGSRRVSLEELVKLWNLENEKEILGLIERARTTKDSNEQAADLVATAQGGAKGSLSSDTPASDTTSGPLQRIDSATEIQSESGVTASCPPVETKADVDTPHSGRAFGIMTVIALLVLLSAFLIAHQDYRGRWSSFMVR